MSQWANSAKTHFASPRREADGKVRTKQVELSRADKRIIYQFIGNLADVAGIEPETPCLQSRCAAPSLFSKTTLNRGNPAPPARPRDPPGPRASYFLRWALPFIRFRGMFAPQGRQGPQRVISVQRFVQPGSIRSDLSCGRLEKRRHQGLVAST